MNEPPVFDTIQEAWDWAALNHPGNGEILTVMIRQNEMSLGGFHEAVRYTQSRLGKRDGLRVKHSLARRIK